MNKLEYTNLAVEQTEGTVAFAKHMDSVLTVEKLVNTLSEENILKAKKVYITGCGDSWLAGIATRPIFEAMGIECVPMRAIEFTRYLKGEDLKDNLAFFISISGGVTRVVEAAMRAEKYGATTVAVTQNPEGKLGLACSHILPLELLPLERTPGISSYIGSTMALAHSAFRIALVKGLIDEAAYAAYKKDLLDYCLSYGDCLEKIQDQMLDLAGRWKDMKAFDFIGDNADWATAFFSSAKMVEAFGPVTTCDDSEDWNHINAFIREPEKMATMVFANADSPSFGRILETLDVAVSIGRPTLVVTDADPAVFPAEVEICSVPKSKHGWEAPIMQHIPADFLCGYIAVLLNKGYYRQDEPAIWGTEIWNARLKEGTKIDVL